jgi:hypothetical protein
MGRKRDTKRDGKLPPYVYRRPALDLVEYRQYLGNGNFGKSVYLRDADGKTLGWNASVSAIIMAYHRMMNLDTPERTRGGLLDEYLKSAAFANVAPVTKRHYGGYVGLIKARELKGGLSFGDAPLAKITRSVLARYRDSMSAAPVSANRHLQFLSAVFSWALEREYVKENPAIGVKKNTEKARDNYITDDDYALVLGLAPAWLQGVMELSYLCRARIGEIRDMTKNRILEEGIYLKRSKGSDSEITQWSDRLREAYNMATQRYANAKSNYVVRAKDGSQIGEDAFESAWKRVMVKAKKHGLAASFPFHDIKAKGITDHTEHASGHRTLKAKKVYIRLPDKVSATK